MILNHTFFGSSDQPLLSVIAIPLHTWYVVKEPLEHGSTRVQYIVMTPQQLVVFYLEAEKLKATLRHSWLHDGARQESVAEHTWMMTLLALVLAPAMQSNLNISTVLHMIIIHDLAEAITKDMPAWVGTANKQEKEDAEHKAMEKLLGNLDQDMREHLFSIWKEYEKRETKEALFVKALDSLDVLTQHYVAPLETWDANDFLWQLSPSQNTHFDIDPLLRQIKDYIDQLSIQKVAAQGKLDRLDQTELKKRVDQQITVKTYETSFNDC